MAGERGQPVKQDGVRRRARRLQRAHDGRDTLFPGAGAREAVFVQREGARGADAVTLMKIGDHAAVQRAADRPRQRRAVSLRFRVPDIQHGARVVLPIAASPAEGERITAHLFSL